MSSCHKRRGIFKNLNINTFASGRERESNHGIKVLFKQQYWTAGQQMNSMWVSFRLVMGVAKILSFGKFGEHKKI